MVIEISRKARLKWSKWKTVERWSMEWRGGVTARKCNTGGYKWSD